MKNKRSQTRKIKSSQKKQYGKSNPRGSFAVICGICLAFLSILAGIFLPKLILEKKADSELSVVKKASETYYLASETAMAKNASEQLSSLDRIKLVSGTWESTAEKKVPGSSNLTESEAVTLAKQKLEIFNQYNIYPFSFSASYDNWYSWTTELYEYTDKTFGTYTTYLWVIHFIRFDGSLSHTVLMMENGTILAAEASEIPNSLYPIRIAYVDEIPTILFSDEKVNISSVTYQMDTSGVDKNSIRIDGYPYIDMTNADFKAICEINLFTNDSEPEPYYLYQYTTDTSYGFGIVPKN